MLNSIEFLVVGSGRSGTQYAALLFSALNLPCGHESFFAPPTEGPGTLLGDASFGVVPYLAGIQTTVFHQVRHPLAVLRSILATGFFAEAGEYAPYLELIGAALPGLAGRPDQLSRAMHYVSGWNRLCEPHARLRWRVEDLDAPTLRQATLLIGRPRSLEECAAALATTPRDANRLELRGLSRVELGWEGLPPGPDKQELLELARRYGYRT